MRFTVRAFRRPLVAVAMPACVIAALTGCGGDNSDADTSAPRADVSATAESPEPAADTPGNEDANNQGDDFCSVVMDLRQHFGVIDTGMTDDSKQTAESVAAARALLESAEPPPDLEKSWSDVAAFYVAVDDAFAEVTVTAGKATAAVLGDAALDVPATVGPAVDGIDMIENHAATECGANGEPLTPAASSETIELCAILTTEDLASVFEADVPAVRDGSFGPKAQECIWESPDETMVSVMLLIRDDFDAQFLQKSGEPRAVVAELENGQLHTGTFGLGRFSTQGSSVYFTAGDWGGTANVRTGESGDATVDDPIAIKFATLIADAVS